jgi:3'(2'), 5'-bisphosphate nucleotidase
MDKREQQPHREFEPSDTTQKVLRIAEKASKLLLQTRQSPLEVKFKKNDKFDPVTIADKSSDGLIRSLLSQEFPDDLILSEENENIPQDFKGRVWMVDPLDGTKEYVKGGDGFSINIGLWENGQLVMGLVNVPARQQIYFAEKGKGSYRQVGLSIERLQVSNITELSQGKLITRISGGDTRPLDTAVSKLNVAERIEESSIGIKIGLIAEGKAEAHVNTNFRASKWDTAGPQLILEEAGGIVTDIDGNPLDYAQVDVNWGRSFVAVNNKAIHQDIVQSIK